MQDRWWIWTIVIIGFVAFNALRAVIRGTKNAQGGMARLNAAAERVLKERGVTASNPLPRTKSGSSSGKPMQGKKPATPVKARRSPAVMTATATPAVIRRGSLLSGGREPVIQRRR